MSEIQNKAEDGEVDQTGDVYNVLRLAHFFNPNEDIQSWLIWFARLYFDREFAVELFEETEVKPDGLLDFETVGYYFMVVSGLGTNTLYIVVAYRVNNFGK